MKTKRSSTLSPRPLALLTLAVFTLIAIALRARADDSTVTISAAEFQRLVYSAHLHAELAERPELDAGLRVLLELHRRNPHADPSVVAGVVRETTDRYRTNGAACIQSSGFRDEILAVYLDTLRQVASRTNLVPINMTLLSGFMLGREDCDTNLTPAQQFFPLVQSGNQRLFSSVGEDVKRQKLIDSCVARAHGNAAFAGIMERIMEDPLRPETAVSMADSPLEIIGNTNSSLHDNLTMQTLLALSLTNAGNLTVSSNLLISLFTNETKTFWDTINTNLALQREISLNQADLLAYLTNQPALESDSNRLFVAKQGQARRIACATAAVLVQSKLMQAKDPLIPLPGQMQGLVEGLHKMTDGLAAFAEKDATKLAKIASAGNMLAGGLQLLDLFAGGESAEDAMARELGNIKTLLQDLSKNMDYRFDRVDRSLTTIFDTLNEQFNQITNYFNEQGVQIARLNGKVDELRLGILDVRADLTRLESKIFNQAIEAARNDLAGRMNDYLFWEIQNPNTPLSYDGGVFTYMGGEAEFYNYANQTAQGYTCSPLIFPSAELAGSALERQLATYPLDANLNYIKKCLTNLAVVTEGTLPLANPRDWFMGAYAYLQLALENPIWYRLKGGTRLSPIIAAGQNLNNFFRSLTLTGANANTNLFAALENNYLRKLTNFTAQVRSLEQAYGADHGFAVDAWRQWSATVPRVNAANTEILFSPLMALPPVPRDAKAIAAGARHSLALRLNGTVLGWGDNTSGQTSIPARATNIVAIAAGLEHSVALQSNGRLVAWGSNTYGQTNTAASATNVVAISAGHYHSLALCSNGTVIAWGAGTNTGTFPNYGQSQVPADATNIMAVAAGGYHSLALRSNGTVVVWGVNNEGQDNIPTSATNIVAIAAGHGHNLALKADGTLVAWGNDRFNNVSVGITNVPVEATNIVAVAAAGWHCLALRADGRLFAWGLNEQRQCLIPPAARGAQALAAGFMHSLALKGDGTVVDWGANDSRQSLVPPSMSWEHVIASAPNQVIALRHDGNPQVTTTSTDPDSENYRPSIPAEATNIVAIVAGGSWSTHYLALRGDGSLVTWGDNFYGQTSTPASATNIVAIAAGKSHSVALRGNGTVVAWGNNDYGQTNVPAGLANVVAIAAGYDHNLALCANGTLVAWGSMTNLPVGLSNVVALAAGSDHNLALRADGTVVGWGSNTRGQTNISASVTNVIAIVAGDGMGLALRGDGTVVWLGDDTYASGPFDYRNRTGLSNVAAIARGYMLKHNGEVVDLQLQHHTFAHSPEAVGAIAAGAFHNLALPLGGSHRGWIHGWGNNSASQATGAVWPDPIPPSYPIELVQLYLHDYFVGMGSPRPYVVTNVIAVAAGFYHSLALRADGTVVAWGANGSAQTSVPTNLNNVVAIAAGSSHSLALRADGTVIGWGYDGSGQRNPPPTAINVVAIAAGEAHSLVLRADGKVVAWGSNSQGQTNTPANLDNVVAIAAGDWHNLALKADGTVIGWGAGRLGTSGEPNYGQASIPLGLSNVVAIAAGRYHSLALKSDGTAIGWGDNYRGQALVPIGATNLIAIAAGRYHSLFLKVTATNGPVVEGGSFLVRGQVPTRFGELLRDFNAHVQTNLNLDLHEAAVELSGAKALLRAVIELGMPYTLERDDVLHGFLYGSEPLMDLDASSTFLQAENGRLEARPDVRPQLFGDVSVLRFLRFKERLDRCLADIQDTRQAETPRIVGHTLRLLNLLQEAHRGSPNNSPPPTLELGRESNSPRLVLYGEPYVHYGLQYSDDLNAPLWSSATVTNLQSQEVQASLHSETDIVSPPLSTGPQRFYRAVLPPVSP